MQVDKTAPYYMQRLAEISVTEEPFLDVNLQHVAVAEPALYKRILAYPTDVLPYLDMIVNDVFFAEYPDADLRYQIEIRPFNATKTRNMRALNPEGTSFFSLSVQSAVP